jgi:hypothetical protein
MFVGWQFSQTCFLIFPEITTVWKDYPDFQKGFGWGQGSSSH